MTKSGDGKSKCFSIIFSRLLCTRSLPTHPSDEFIESNGKEFGDPEPQEVLKLDNVEDVKQDGQVFKAPGVVARLMGLESLPSSPLCQSNKTLGSYLRSRSVNSIDFLSHFDHGKKGQDEHRRHQTSVSFREGLEKDYCFIIEKLKEVDESEEFMIERKPKVNCEQIKKGKGVRVQKNEKLLEKNVKKDNFHGRTRVDSKGRKAVMKRVDRKEAMVGLKSVKKKKQVKQSLAHVVHSPERGMKKVQFEATLQEVPQAKHLRKALSPQRSYLSNANGDSGKVEVIELRGSGGKLENREESCYYERMVEQVFRLTKEDLEERWVFGKFEDLEEICQQFGEEILEDLLEQLLDEQFIMCA